MAEPFIGELRLFPIGFAPRGWAFCEGQLLQISTNQALYTILGNTYGGNGITNFALPDLRGRVPINLNPQAGFALGRTGGEASHTLTINEMPAHGHSVKASSNGATSGDPTGKAWAGAAGPYSAVTNPQAKMNSGAFSMSGGSQPHSNMQPYLALHFCIALTGIYPSRN